MEQNTLTLDRERDLEPTLRTGRTQPKWKIIRAH